MSGKRIAERALEQGAGILRLAPAWVPRSFCVPGRRLKLHPADYYALGGDRGGIDERWLSSTTAADNGPKTGPDEGLSRVVVEDGGRTETVLLREAVEELGAAVIGARLWREHHGWPLYSKFFDNKGALPHHVHHRDRHAKLVGRAGKPESYFFPPQLNNHGGDFPYTFFGLRPGTTKDQVRECLVNFARGDNRITDLSSAYRLEPGTGWDVPAGHPARAGQPVHLRAAEGLGRVLHVPVAHRRRHRSPGAAVEGRAEGPGRRRRVPPRHPGLGGERGPGLRGPALPAAPAGAPGRRDARRGLGGELDLVPVAGFQRQGADGAARGDRDDPRRGRLRHDPAAGAREDGAVGHRHPRPHPVRAAHARTSSS